MDNYYTLLIFYLAAFGLAMALSSLFTLYSIRISHRFGFLDHPDDRKAHGHPMPYLGGVAIFMAFWGVVFLGLAVAHLMPSGRSGLPGVAAGAVFLTPKILGIFLGSLLILFVGFVDDKYALAPLKKLLGQVAAALILMRMGFMINLVSGLGFEGYVVTFIWILLIMNAFNFIDSLDGHCAGIALLSSLMFFWITQIIGQPLVGLFLLAFAGALAGFLPHNFKPAKVFLGDNGSLFIGYLMAAITLLCKYQTQGRFDLATTFIPALIFGVPIYDTLSVIVVRLKRGTVPWKGDRNHFAHRLVKMGMSERVAVVFSYFIAVTIGLVAILATQVTFFGAVLIFLIFLSILGVIAFLEFYATKRQRIMEELAKRHRRRREDILDAEEKEF